MIAIDHACKTLCMDYSSIIMHLNLSAYWKVLALTPSGYGFEIEEEEHVIGYLNEVSDSRGM